MKDIYSRYLSDESWLIHDDGWVRELQGVRETQLALGNGHIGSRAVLEEMPYDAKPGTYITGLYDRIGSQVSELVNLPNPFNFKIMAEGEKLGVITMDAVRHRRMLDIKKGLLTRYTVFQDSKKRSYDYQSIRFLSAKNKNIGIIQVAITPLDHDVTFSIETGIDTSVYNTGTVTEGRKRHFRVKELNQFDNEGYLMLQTFSKEHMIIIRSGFYYKTLGKKTYAEDNIFELDLKKGQTVIFTKIFYIGAIKKNEDLDKKKKLSEKNFRKAFGAGFDRLIGAHIKAFRALWDTAEISIWGDAQKEKDMRFNIYHLLICAGNNNGASSIGAKGLTGEGYRGHIFWDAEIFTMPFYIYTMPETAKNMLLYRYNRMDAAKDIARKEGYKGAMFPWESADIGIDETPEWAKDLDGKIIKIHTGRLEHHITADIAYAAYHYYNVTHDEDFMREYGYELIFECARFWISRVKYNKNKRKYEINNVIGPDEFHERVDNNAYTNMMAKWNLLLANKLYHRLRKAAKKTRCVLEKRLGLTYHEAVMWKNIAARISFKIGTNGLIEQFKGYYRLKHVKINNYDEDYMPIVPKRLTPRGYRNTQFVKQADVVMLLSLLSDVFGNKTKKRNYEYYVEKTLHKSSLSLPMHALMGIHVGDRSRAYRFFDAALRTDISNIHGNVAEGIHIACIGATWQAFIHGFAGARMEKDILSVDPRLPRTWRKILFSLMWRGSLLKFEVKNDKIKIQLVPKSSVKHLKIKVFGAAHEISSGRLYTFTRTKRSVKKNSYYL